MRKIFAKLRRPALMLKRQSNVISSRSIQGNWICSGESC